MHSNLKCARLLDFLLLPLFFSGCTQSLAGFFLQSQTFSGKRREESLFVVGDVIV